MGSYCDIYFTSANLKLLEMKGINVTTLQSGREKKQMPGTEVYITSAGFDTTLFRLIQKCKETPDKGLSLN